MFLFCPASNPAVRTKVRTKSEIVKIILTEKAKEIGVISGFYGHLPKEKMDSIHAAAVYSHENTGQ